MTHTRILVVDDEPKLVRLVHEVLTATGYAVLSTGSGEAAIEMVALEQPDLILLDIVLASAIDGYEVARRVREFSGVPIIMLTAKARESDLLRGFDVGADDYLTKPFSSKELLVRVRAVLKRARHEPVALTEAEIICGNLRIDLARRRVTVDDREVHLTRTEYNLLHELARHRDQVLLHAQLLTAVWGSEYRDDLDYLRAYIRYLRQKLEADPSNPKLIVTHPGVGYMLVCSENPAA
ncbi:MAG TPA: response regulator transcription factor [Anaerolineae bacterium]|nr:response regulator transcription factor [Anaerolineae bacterium]